MPANTSRSLPSPKASIEKLNSSELNEVCVTKQQRLTGAITRQLEYEEEAKLYASSDDDYEITKTDIFLPEEELKQYQFDYESKF